MKIRNLIWDEWNIEHVGKHGVSQDEVEEVCSSKHFAIKSGKTKMAVWGRTEGGRYLLVIVGVRGFYDYYPVSAREMDDREKRNFRKWIKR
ncbi:BrnT family toxin [Candidatus Microgenomates bacterium]|nr:BrnT family toxin [Candidatus Microgenomates bacterium]